MIYLDNAATTRKKPLCAYFSFIKENLFSANPGRGVHRAAVSAALKIEETRRVIREKFFDGDVIFTKNCTEALNLAFTAKIKYKKVITSTAEHTSVLRPLKRLSEQGKIVLDIVDPSVEEFRKNIDRATGMVVIGAVSNVTGKSNPVEEISKIVKEKSDALVVVDGAQSAGKLDLDLRNVDMFASSGHKSLHGFQGTGFLIVRKGISLDPLVTGGTGISGPVIDVPNDIPEGMEAGTLNGPGIVAFGKAIEYTYKHMARITKKENRLASAFCRSLSEEKNAIIYSCQNGIVLCNVKDRPCSEVADILSQKYGVYVRSGLHCAPLMHKKLGTLPEGAVRVSFGDNNNYFHAIYAAYVFKKICRGENAETY
ncbi:MAG: aminotransferase class V-fold PLP-dependent enzyme [Clostridia bacterium]|nr:aminotransferase class V-fold PLP-dependent enzyme [Clostridia bacterium]